MGEWKSIAELFDFERGTLQSTKCIPGIYTFITAAEGWKTHNTFTHDCEALIFAMGASGSLGRTHYFKGKFISSDLCFILTPKNGLKLDLIFYYRLFNFLRRDLVKQTATGTSKLAINQTNFRSYQLPYFDYEHQIKFRNKIESFTTINDNLSDQTSIQLSFLNNLRQSVLQEAIEGKLTAKWRKEHPGLISGDNHASKLLEKIKTEKQRLFQGGKIRKEKPLASIPDDEKPIDLPDGWVWCKLGELCVMCYGDGLTKIQCKTDGKYPVYGSNGIVGYYDKYLTAKRSIIVGRKGSAGALNKCNEPSWTTDVAYFIEEADFVDFDFLFILLKSLKLENVGKGIKPGINRNEAYNLLVPLPPLAEQKAILERVDKLMAMIYELEKQGSERKDQSEMLMQVVLREAFGSAA